MRKNKLIIGFSVGDLNGIGVEIFLKLFKNKNIFKKCVPVIYANEDYLIDYAKKTLNQVPNLNVINNNKIKENTINVFNVWSEKINIKFGSFEKEKSNMSLMSLDYAVKDYKKKKIKGLITLPINKNVFVNKKIVGHTEYLANLFKNHSPLMMMCKDKLKVSIATTHIPVKDIVKKISKKIIKEKIEILNKSLVKDFKIKKPKIAILGLNPHAGDNGKIGMEEKQIIIPLIKVLEKKIFCFGPFPADSFFGNLKYKQFDGILSLYHDQGLVAFKTLCFQKGVNFTAGIPIIRASPDHGCGYDIAGKGIAKETSLRESLLLILQVIKNRNE